MVTVTPGSGAPLVSVTVPYMLPVEVWEKAGRANSRRPAVNVMMKRT
jgi:hypothetical protein